MPAMVRPHVDEKFLKDTLWELLLTPSPAGYTDSISRKVCAMLGDLGHDPQVTRRGAIRATIAGEQQQPQRAVVAHLDTLGGMVTQLKPNGRLACAPIGTWSSRFAEGARVTIFTDWGHQRGTIMPLLSSGHAYNEQIDTQPVSWDQVEVRIDDLSRNQEELFNAGFRVGDFIAIDPQPEFLDNGYIVSRHLDDKAGVAALLTALKHLRDAKVELPITSHALFTIFEEVGTGAAGVLNEDIAELVSVDNAVNAPIQNSSEYDVTIPMMDSSGPFDYHLVRRLLRLARDHEITHGRDVFRYYRSDAASAVEAGNDIRTALLCFGVDGSHGYERTHIGSLVQLTQLIVLYLQSPAVVARDRQRIADPAGFPEQHTTPPPVPEKRGPDAITRPDPKL